MGGGTPATNHAAVVTYQFIAKTNTLEVVTAGGSVTTAAYTDRNPIMNAVTLEEVLPPTDTDADGLPDEWERIFFGNLSQTGSGDPDGDGLTNAQEYEAFDRVLIKGLPKLSAADRGTIIEEMRKHP